VILGQERTPFEASDSEEEEHNMKLVWGWVCEGNWSRWGGEGAHTLAAVRGTDACNSVTGKITCHKGCPAPLHDDGS
jgi:hypothetical protein